MITLDDITDLKQIQIYMKRTVVERGFADESIFDTFLLLVEEIGELSHFIRKYKNIKVNSETSHPKKSINEEIADIFIYLIILANKFEIDLLECFKKKEIKNNLRKWV